VPKARYIIKGRGRMPAEPMQSSKSKPGITRKVVETILRWFREIWSRYFLQQKRPASVLTTEKRAESVAQQAEAIVTATENAAAEPRTVKSFAEPITADGKVSSDAQSSPLAHIVPDQEEIQRRRDLVRTLFNDFWSGSDDKPAGFADRLNQAENYINERLTACGEFWQLDANTRAMLSLPPGSNSHNKGKTA
jgi:hypothetical protein